MIEPICGFCQEELVEPGGILLHAPFLVNGKEVVEKTHICRGCLTKLDLIRKDWGWY
jgi:hypothetical protein